MDRTGPSRKRGRPSRLRPRSTMSSSSSTPKKRKKRVRKIQDARTEEVKYVAKKPRKYRPFRKYYTQGKPSDSDIKEEMRRVTKCANEVMEETEKLVAKEWKKMKKDVAPLKIDGKKIKPFVFTGAKRVFSTPPPRKCTAEIPTMFYYEPLTGNIEAKEETQLSHIPVVDDNQHDNSILNHLVEKFPSGIHGLIVNDIEMSEEMLYKTMKRVLPGTKNPDLLYYALYQIFNNSGSQKDFSEMFPKLHRVYGDGEPLNLEPWKTLQTKKLRQKEIEFGPHNLKPLGIAKKVFVRSSKIAGNGLYLGEDVEQNEYIGEYVGEHCLWDEVRRRDCLARLAISYAVDLPNYETIDSEHAGNVFRFANNSMDPNCVGLLARKEPRVPIYAVKAMKAGTELTLNYQYPEILENIFLRSLPKDRVPLTPEAASDRTAS